MNLLVIGSGGREHALAWKLRQSPQVKELYCAPGNAGIEGIATLVPIKATDIDALAEFAERKKIDLTVVGPEQPLVMGIADLFAAKTLNIFGPGKNAAQLEGSKAFAKDFMVRHGIPTARYKVFSKGAEAEARTFIQGLRPPVVVKADGLAGGKGVAICETHEAGIATLQELVDKRVLGGAGDQVVIEEFLAGEEASMFAVSDGTDFFTLAPAQDHKRIFDGDLGKNTGGMGAYAPAPLMSPQLQKQVVEEIIKPTLDGMREEGMPYRGCLYVGLMITSDGPKVLEYNCRFGDPETQVVVPLVDGDLAALLLAAASGSLKGVHVAQHQASAVCVVMASRGYPDKYETGKEIRGLDSVVLEEGEVVFHAGTTRAGNHIVTSGGRVLGVTAVGFDHDLEGTIQAAYRIVHRIAFDGAYYRSDIGQKALRRPKQSSGDHVS